MEQERKVKVWDPFVRLFHWALLLAFTIAFLTEFHTLRLHVYAGYAVTGLVALRIIWGIIGAKNARFSDFIYSPKDILTHLRDMARFKHKHYLGHNPAAGAMALLLLALLVATTFTGFLTYGAKEVAGPFASILIDVGWRWGKELEEIHHFLAATTFVMAVMHVAGAVLESVVHKENLIFSMITGYKRADKSREVQA